MEWISVKDRLPETMDVYLTAFSNGGAWVAAFHPSDKTWDVYKEAPGYLTVTHWMKIPDTPK
jgi:hypothetical protein